MLFPISMNYSNDSCSLAKYSSKMKFLIRVEKLSKCKTTEKDNIVSDMFDNNDRKFLWKISWIKVTWEEALPFSPHTKFCINCLRRREKNTIAFKVQKYNKQPIISAYLRYWEKALKTILIVLYMMISKNSLSQEQI